EDRNLGRGIADHAEKAAADLIILGALGRTNLRYLLLGSTAERVLTRLPCSVLVVKPPHE
ncbi:MAG TPA: universal stress protein, partial [Prosthecobacter sp.]|nr:universal stress protein [Prosthecobacter sp.]